MKSPDQSGQRSVQIHRLVLLVVEVVIEREMVLLVSGALIEEEKVLLGLGKLDEVEKMVLASVALAGSWCSLDLFP